MAQHSHNNKNDNWDLVSYQWPYFGSKCLFIINGINILLHDTLSIKVCTSHAAYSSKNHSRFTREDWLVKWKLWENQRSTRLVRDDPEWNFFFRNIVPSTAADFGRNEFSNGLFGGQKKMKSTKTRIKYENQIYQCIWKLQVLVEKNILSDIMKGTRAHGIMKGTRAHGIQHRLINFIKLI
jgi:hypothetical protein